MMKNVEMLKDINPQKMMAMSIEERKKLSDEMMKNSPKEDYENAMPKVEDMPGPYCANGVAACKDLDFSKVCICSGCRVFKDFNLKGSKPTIYFCKDGKAMS
jgi:hypothetical protein